MKIIIASSAIVVALVCSAACGHEAPPGPPESAAPAAHEHHAPHGGRLVELGGEFAHVELVLDPDAGSLTAYFLDGEAEESVRLTQPSVTVALDAPGGGAPQMLELAARADILTGETVGDSSEFSATHPSLNGRRNMTGRIVVIAVKGQVFLDVRF